MISEDLNSKHNFSQDRQLQNNLLAADDTFEQALQGDTPFSVSMRLRPNIPDKVCEVTGWCPNGKIVLRKPENDLFSKPKTAGGSKDQDRVWRDPRLRRDQIQEGNFVFHHYHDSHMYIEQYRKEHSCLSKTQSLSDYQSLALNNARNDHISDYIPQDLSNMPKKDQTPNLSQQSPVPSEPGPRHQKIKVTPVIGPSDGNISMLKWPEDPEIVSTSIFHQFNCSASRASSAATSKIPASKLNVKMSSPAALTISSPSVLKLLNLSKKTRGSRGSWNANGDFKTPTLARVENKGYKEPKEEDRNCEDQAAMQEEPKVMEVTSMSPFPFTPGMVSRYQLGDEAVDMTEMNTNVFPKCQLSREPSCQCEWLLQSFMLATNSVPLRPFRPELLHHSQTMFGYLQPNSVARTEQHTHRALEKGFEMSEPYNYLKQITVSSKGYASQVHGGLKGTTTKPDLPATFQLHGMSKQCHSSTQKVQAPAQNSAGRRQKGRLFRRTTNVHEVQAGDPQTQPTRPATVSGEVARHSCHELASSSCVTQMPATSYLKFWKSRTTDDFCNKKNFMRWESAKSSTDPQDLLELNPAQKARAETKHQNPHSDQLARQVIPVASAAFGVASPETPNALAVYSQRHSVVLNQRPHTSYTANNNSFTENTIASPKTKPSDDLTSGDESSLFTTSLPLDLLGDLTSTNNNSLLSAVTSSSKEYSQNVPVRIGIDKESISTTPVCQVKQKVPTQVTLVSSRTGHQKLLSNTESSIQPDQGLNLQETSNKEADSRKESCSQTLHGNKSCLHRSKQPKLIFLPDVDDGTLAEKSWWHPQNSLPTRLTKQILHQAQKWSGNLHKKIPIQNTSKKSFSKATPSPIYNARTSQSRCNKLPGQCTNPRSAKSDRQSCKKNQETFDKDVGSIGSCLVDDTNSGAQGRCILSCKRWSKSGSFHREFRLENRLWARAATATHINTGVARHLYVAGYQLNSLDPSD